MAHIVKLTQMNGVPILIGLAGVKQIEQSTYTPKHHEPEAIEGKAPKTTQTVIPAEKAVIEPVPVICSLITYHDDHTMVVSETLDAIQAMATTGP